MMNGERTLLEIETDDTVAKLNAMRRSVEKDIYRMRQFGSSWSGQRLQAVAFSFTSATFRVGCAGSIVCTP